MREIQHHKYSLFSLEKNVGDYEDPFKREPHFQYIDTADTLEEILDWQKRYKLKTIILISY